MIPVSKMKEKSIDDVIADKRYTISQVAAILGVSRGTIYRAIENNELKAHRTRNRQYSTGREIMQYEHLYR